MLLNAPVGAATRVPLQPVVWRFGAALTCGAMGQLGQRLTPKFYLSPRADFRPQANFDCHSPRVAPVGSVIILIQPAPGTSVTPRTILAPSDFAFSVAALMSLTST